MTSNNRGLGSPELRWRKSIRSNDGSGGGNCVMVAVLPTEAGHAVHDSKVGVNGGVLAAEPAVWASFLNAAKAGKFDRA
ncbi:DUF397 domain-containing protein [Solihabitans fulvus]|uniref:DUF397 domain-containing protein n=1 Tax=Solihabitans fulvus TaxID=1892852 RepID=UPI001CB767DC|nr:DUF397 domain-containing protein [Solihabitans fulvus]